MRKATEISRYVEAPNGPEGIRCKTTVRKRPLHSHMDNVLISFPFFSKTTKSLKLYILSLCLQSMCRCILYILKPEYSKVCSKLQWSV